MSSVIPSASTSPWNVPNLLTSIRFCLAIAVIVLIGVAWYGWALAAFLIAASTDWMDGYWARRYGQVTKLGRIFDPFVDKIVVCGAFIALVEVGASGVAAWMAILVVARELLVTSLRGLIEAGGGDFSARQLGKWKMVLQCVAVAAALLCLIQVEPEAWLVWLRWVSLWSAILLTLYSGLDYVLVAARVIGQPSPPSTDGTK